VSTFFLWRWSVRLEAACRFLLRCPPAVPLRTIEVWITHSSTEVGGRVPQWASFESGPPSRAFQVVRFQALLSQWQLNETGHVPLLADRERSWPRCRIGSIGKTETAGYETVEDTERALPGRYRLERLLENWDGIASLPVFWMRCPSSGLRPRFVGIGLGFDHFGVGDPGGDPSADPGDEPGEPALGRAPHPRRTAQARIDVGQTSVAKYTVRRRGGSQGWRTFLRNHADGIVSMDLFVVPTLPFRLLYGFVILRHRRRRIIWLSVTANPTAEWMRNS